MKKINEALTVMNLFKKSPYSLDIESDFIEQFFKDRKLVTDLTKKYLAEQKRLLKGTVHALKMGGTQIFGQTTMEENYALSSLVRQTRPENVVEIGLFRGQTALTLNRALGDGGRYFGIDIDKDAIEISRQVLNKGDFPKATLLQGDSGEMLNKIEHIDFAYIDGDHSFEGVRGDFLSIYNKLKEGGIVALHDVGTKAWGFNTQGPGILFYHVLPKVLEGHAAISWLDSMNREATMRLLSPANEGPFKYGDSREEAAEIAQTTAVDTVNGWGGLGFVIKINSAHKLELNQLLIPEKPLRKVSSQGQKPVSLIGRIARKIANHIP